MKNLVRPRLLIIDDVGYRTVNTTQASLVFQVIAERYEKVQAENEGPRPSGSPIR